MHTPCSFSRRCLIPLFLLIVGAAALPAQTLGLSTSFAGSGVADGHFFDVGANRTVTLCRLDMNLAQGTHTVEVWFGLSAGSYVPIANQPGAFGLLGTATVVSTGSGAPTAIPIELGLTLAAGSTQALYVTTTNPNAAPSFHETGVMVGATAAQNADLRILEGSSARYPFSPLLAPRRWNGTIYYTLGTASSGCRLYQLNQATASLTVNGLSTSGFLPPVTTVGSGSSVNVSVNGTIGRPYDMAIVATSLVPNLGGPFQTQLINVDLTHPSRGFLFGGLNPAFVPLTPFSSQVATGFACNTTSAQLFVIDFSTPEFFRLSQGSEIRVVPGGIPMLPQSALALDDGNLTVSFGCPTFGFYGVNYSQLHVSTNGRVLFAAMDTDFSPTTAEITTDGPFVGYWNDFNLSAAGFVTVSSAGPDLFEVRFQSIPHFSVNTNLNNFTILLDAADGSVILNGLQGILPNIDPSILGITRGNLGATNPGPRSWNIGQNAGSVGSEALYDFFPGSPQPGGRCATLQNGVNTLWFAPQGTNYYVTAF
jgi:hypothetical protein